MLGSFDFLESLSATLEEEATHDPDIAGLVKAHLSILRNELRSYFPDLIEGDMKMIRNTFNFDVNSLPDRLREEFIARDRFEAVTLTKFWSEMIVIYPRVAVKAVKSLLMFPSTYLCEFSALLAMIFSIIDD